MAYCEGLQVLSVATQLPETVVGVLQAGGSP